MSIFKKKNNNPNDALIKAVKLGQMESVLPFIEKDGRPNLSFLLNNRENQEQSVCDIALEHGQLTSLLKIVPEKDHAVLLHGIVKKADPQYLYKEETRFLKILKKNRHVKLATVSAFADRAPDSFKTRENMGRINALKRQLTKQTSRRLPILQKKKSR